MQQWLVIEQVEDILRPLKRSSIRAYAGRGKIVARRPAPRLQLYLRSSVEEYRERHLGRKGWNARRRAETDVVAADSRYDPVCSVVSARDTVKGVLERNGP